MGLSKTPNVDYRGKPRKDFVMKTITIFSRLLDYFRFVITGKSDNFVDQNILDFSGQGRDRYGR